MNILDIAIAKKLAGGGGGSGTDNYNDLSNLPKINDTTLSGNKSSSALGLQSEINSDSKLASDLVDDTNQDNKFVTSAEKNTWNAKQNAIDADHKLSSDLVDDANKTNKFVTSTEKNTWNAKQNAIDSDHKLSSDLVDDANKTNKFVTSTEKNTWNAKQNAIDSDHKLSSDLVDDANKTNKFVTSTEKQTWNAKQNAIDSDHKLSSSLVSFSAAEAAALASGIDSSKVGQISTNQTNILYVLNKSGSKNVLVPKYDKYTNNEVSYTVNADGTITVVIASTTAANRELPITDAISNVYDGMIISGSPSGNNIEYLITGLKSDGTYENEQFSYNQAHSTINRGTPKIKFSIYVTSGTAAQTVTIYPMVQDASITDFTFAKPALPNYDLTYLQAEDRASLAEVVDSGAKNKLQLYPTPDTYTKDGITYVVYSDGSVQADGTCSVAAGSNSQFKLLTADSGGYIANNYKGYIASGCSGGSLDYPDPTYGLLVMYSTTGSSWADQDGIANGGNITIKNYPYFTFNIVVYGGKTIHQRFYPMICTKAAFGVSKAFVPYRPNYDLVCDAVNIVDITSALTLATGYTATNRTHIFKQGKHVFGTIVIHKDSGNFGEGYEIAYMNTYRPKYQWVGLSGFGTEEWNVKSIGYAFVDSTSPGKILVSDTITTNNYVQIQLDYYIT